MREILKNRGLRLVLMANLISMIGSGLNTAAVTWYVLQATHSETALGTMLMLQTIPAIIMLPFSGVVIDREDRRKLVMILDAARGLVILTVAVLAVRGMAKLWEVYLMSVMVAAAFWMFWPTMNALIQELTPESEFVRANSLLVAGLQGGWLVAGSVVGFVYNSIGLGGVLFIDFASYAISFLCYLFVRRGHHVVAAPETSVPPPEGAVRRFIHEMREGIAYMRPRPRVVLVGITWALFMGAMLSQGIITAPFSDRILKAGAVGYGWLNGGWAIGACTSALFMPAIIRALGHRRAITVAMVVLGTGLIIVPGVASHLHGAGLMSLALMASVVIYAIMGCCRALGGVAITTTMMELVPRHFMGRVQNTFYFSATCLQFVLSFVIGATAHARSLTLAFALVGGLYLLACITSAWPIRENVHGKEPAGDLEAQSAG
jgi:MFS family permease